MYPQRAISVARPAACCIRRRQRQREHRRCVAVTESCLNRGSLCWNQGGGWAKKRGCPALDAAMLDRRAENVALEVCAWRHSPIGPILRDVTTFVLVSRVRPSSFGRLASVRTCVVTLSILWRLGPPWGGATLLSWVAAAVAVRACPMRLLPRVCYVSYPSGVALQLGYASGARPLRSADTRVAGVPGRAKLLLHPTPYAQP